MSPQELESVERYVLGQMSGDELSAFEKTLRTDESLQHEVALFKNIIITVEGREVKNTIANIFQQKKVNQKQPVISTSKVRSPKIRSLAKYLIPLAAAIIGAFIYFSRPITQENKSLFATYYSTDPGLPTPMGQSEKVTFYDGMVDFKMGNFDKAYDQWQPLLDMNQSNDTLQFYMAMVLMENSKLGEAQVLLAQVNKNKESTFWHKAVWYQSLLLLKQNKKQEARELLESLIGGDHVHSEQAGRLYREIQKE